MKFLLSNCKQEHIRNQFILQEKEDKLVPLHSMINN